MDWEWELDEIDAGRAKRASNVRLADILIEGQQASADVVEEKTGETVYHTTLNECDCEDFHFNTKGNKPCKHILALAMALGIVNQDGHTPDQQLAVDIAALKERIAVASGYYHVFHVSTVTDSAYDAMKAKLARLQAEQKAMP